MKSFMFALVVAIAAARNPYQDDWESATPDCERKRICGNRGNCDDGEVCRDYSSFTTCSDVWSYEFCERECPDGERLDPTRYCTCIPEETYQTMFCEEQCDCPELYEPVECHNFRTGTVKYTNQC